MTQEPGSQFDSSNGAMYKLYADQKSKYRSIGFCVIWESISSSYTYTRFSIVLPRRRSGCTSHFYGSGGNVTKKLIVVGCGSQNPRSANGFSYQNTNVFF
jgi:hypothetical protein